MKELFFHLVEFKVVSKKIAGLTYAPDPVHTASASAAVVAFLSPPLPPKTCRTTSLVRNLTSDLAELENLTASGQQEESLPPQATSASQSQPTTSAGMGQTFDLK